MEAVNRKSSAFERLSLLWINQPTPLNIYRIVTEMTIYSRVNCFLSKSVHVCNHESFLLTKCHFFRCFFPQLYTLSEKIAHPTVYHHLSQLSVDIQLNGMIKCKEDSGVQMKLNQVILCSLSWIHLSQVHWDSGLRWYPTELTEMPADSTDLELVISCSSVSCL